MNVECGAIVYPFDADLHTRTRSVPTAGYCCWKSSPWGPSPRGERLRQWNQGVSAPRRRRTHRARKYINNNHFSEIWIWVVGLLAASELGYAFLWCGRRAMVARPRMESSRVTLLASVSVRERSERARARWWWRLLDAEGTRIPYKYDIWYFNTEYFCLVVLSWVLFEYNVFVSNTQYNTWGVNIQVLSLDDIQQVLLKYNNIL